MAVVEEPCAPCQFAYDLIKFPLYLPQVSGEVKPEVIALLVTAKCYVKAFHTIFPFERIKDETFWPLIHGLACHGIYAMNEGDSVNHAVLSQTAPFMEVILICY